MDYKEASKAADHILKTCILDDPDGRFLDRNRATKIIEDYRRNQGSEHILDLEVFAVRDGETVQFSEERPTHHGRWFAIMARSVEMPPGNRSSVRWIDGEPVEQCAILAAQLGRLETAWQWMQLSPPTKERLGGMMFANNLERDRWYFVSIGQAAMD
jgi:hypothetical protein